MLKKLFKREPQIATGVGYVFHNPDTGEEYSRNHPIHSGEVPDATGIRRSTPMEDALHDAYRSEWDEAHIARAELAAAHQRRIAPLMQANARRKREAAERKGGDHG